MGEGIAVITVTDHNGNKQTCDVTVSGTANMETFYGWVETGLASGKSKTYRYVPEETGMYWFFSELGAEWGIELTDVNGNAVTEKYEYTEDERCGKVYELTAGTEYRMTLQPGRSQEHLCECHDG